MPLNNPLLQPKALSRPAATPARVPKTAPIPESLVALNGRPVAPVLSDEDAYCWVFHPDYGFYFIEGTTNNHYRFFKGSGSGTSNTEVIPNKLYDDCNRGYMFVDRKKKTVQIQTAKLVQDYLDFVPKQVLAGFKQAFPGYEVYLKGCHMASRKTADWDEAYEAQVCDATSEAALNIIAEYTKHIKDKNYRQDWDLVPFPRLKKIWEDYMKTGFVRDEGGLNQIAEILVYNVAALQVNTTLCSHTSQYPSAYAEDITGKRYPDGYFERNYDFFTDDKGAWRISDYAMDDLTHLACEIRRATTPERKLFAMDKLLNVVHQRSDLAGWFVQGGSRALSQLSQTPEKMPTPSTEPEPRKKKTPVSNNQMKLPFTSSLLKKKALDAVLETMDQEKLPDQEYTTQNGKMMGKGTEVEQGALNDAIPGSLLASKCAACESGDCIGHMGGGTINDLTNAVVTPKPPVESDIQDANFFKESENDFDATVTAGKLVVADTPSSDVQEAQDNEQEQLTQEELARMKQADTKSYGAGTPNGGTPQAPPPSPAQPTPPPPGTPNPVPPVQTVNKTPGQLHDEAQGAPQEAGNLTQQQLSQVLDALKHSSVRDFTRALAAIPIKDSPTSLPPRDDMRRHIDETAQDEVMEGVGNSPSPAPAAPQAAPAPVAQPPAPVAPTAQQELLKQTLASADGRKLSYVWEDEDEDDDDDDGPDGSYGTMYGKPLGKTETVETSRQQETPQDRLEYLRSELRAERISQSGLNELGDLAEHIEPDDVELLEAAGVPEDEEERAQFFSGRQTQPIVEPKRKRFRPTNKDKDLLKSMGIKAKLAIQTEEGVNLACPACHGQDVTRLNTNQEDDSLVECLTCGCFFAV